MATLVLAAAGSAIGGAAGGAAFGVGAALIGQTAGAVLGGMIDQSILGSGSRVVERGRSGSLRLQSAHEGAPIPRVVGRMRVAGQVIWSTRFLETVDENSVGGKGARQTVREYGYSLSFAVALAEGPIDRIGRVWADGKPLDLEKVAHRIHLGDESQSPDPLIEAVEGEAPAFRGVAYIVFEDMPLAVHGNRAPQISAEVFRQPRVKDGTGQGFELDRIVRGVAMSPGTGEFAYETDLIRVIEDEGRERIANSNSWLGKADALVSLDQLEGELPAARAVSLVVSWFGTDLRCDRCELRPGVEHPDTATEPHVWSVSGTTREAAHVVGRDEQGRPVFGGTPSDGSIVRYIREMKARGIRVTFYPFILMDIGPGNGLTDPWSGQADQPVYPWRGRITTSLAPGTGTVDGSPAATDEVAAFFGTAAPGDFAAQGDTVAFSGSEDWGMRRFILHYAHLCAMAGGVDAFCIGSEMRSLTQIRSGRTSYPAVEELTRLAADVRGILGPDVKLGYAADWSEYFGHQPTDGSGDRLFHLDPLWASPAIDFVGIDWYAPLSDWRDGDDHLDAAEARSIYDLDYLAGRFAGGEGHDWYYASSDDRAAQTRTPITDGAYGEPWVWRCKDLVNWWSRPHHERVDGVRSAARTAWRPKSKPIWFTEIGCGAVDKGTNQPNLFVDPKSSENGLPHFSTGARDDLIQRRLLQAAAKRFEDPANNPVSPVYGGPMVDLDNAYVWTWDARPWPSFPRRLDVWSDGGNHELGHWLDGRAASASLDRVVREICAEAGLTEVDVSDLEGLVTGFVQSRVQSPREALEALMLAFGFDAVQSAGVLRFVMRGRGRPMPLDATRVVADGSGDGRDVERVRAEIGTLPRSVRLGYVRSEGDYMSGVTEATTASAQGEGVQGSDVPIAFTAGQASDVAERWAREVGVGRESARFALPPSSFHAEPGDLVRFGDDDAVFRIDRMTDGLGRQAEATRIDRSVFRAANRPNGNFGEGIAEPGAPLAEAPTSGRLGFRFLDVPWVQLGGRQDAAHLAIWGDPWPGSSAVHLRRPNGAFEQIEAGRRSATAARLVEPLAAAAPWRVQRGPGVRVRMLTGAMSSTTTDGLLNGANLAALASPSGGWEIVQFRRAELVGPNEYRLSGFMRGVFGTEPLIGDPTPKGSLLILLEARLLPIPMDAETRSVERTYRIGPGSAALDDPSVVETTATLQHVALRPFAPAAPSCRREPDGDVVVRWKRRDRLDADLWLEPEIALSETDERYRVRVFDAAGSPVREVVVETPEYRYPAGDQAADGFAVGGRFEIAQMSATFGPGMDGKVVFNG